MTDTIPCVACGAGFDPLVCGVMVAAFADFRVCPGCIVLDDERPLDSYPIAEPGLAECPSCTTALDPAPKRAGACTACGERFHVRRIPHPEHIDRRVLPPSALPVCEAAWDGLRESHILIGSIPKAGTPEGDAFDVALARRSRERAACAARLRQWHDALPDAEHDTAEWAEARAAELGFSLV